MNTDKHSRLSDRQRRIPHMMLQSLARACVWGHAHDGKQLHEICEFTKHPGGRLVSPRLPETPEVGKVCACPSRHLYFFCGCSRPPSHACRLPRTTHEACDDPWVFSQGELLGISEFENGGPEYLQSFRRVAFMLRRYAILCVCKKPVSLGGQQLRELFGLRFVSSQAGWAPVSAQFFKYTRVSRPTLEGWSLCDGDFVSQNPFYEFGCCLAHKKCRGECVSPS